MKEFVLFDLDGTLTDPKEGITGCVQYALRSFGIEEPDRDKLEPFIGPPLAKSFQEFYGMTAGQAEEAVKKYRERFQNTGIFENTIYAGIPQLLAGLKAAGMKMAVASSKPQVFVERILEHFKIEAFFDSVTGSELDGTRVEKAVVVEEALRRLAGKGGIPREQAAMVGDRRFDVEGAAEHGLTSVAVAYGYGSAEELREAGADYIVYSVAELEALLLRAEF